MYALFDIVHPADVLFFHNVWLRLRDRGTPFRIVSRNKDITTTLLDRLGWPHTPISTAGAGVVDLGRELLSRDCALYSFIRNDRPKVMLGFGGVAISHMTAVTGIPSISFYDTEQASIQIALTLPFISEWHVPDYWTGSLPSRKDRVFHFSGYKELSFFHPENFVTRMDKALTAGYDPDQKNIFVRLISRRANHDIGKYSILSDKISYLMSVLGKGYKWHISSENPLPLELQPYAYKGDILDAHHLLAVCSLYVGESSTMATEAAMLAVPAIFNAHDHLGYIERISAYGMIRHVDHASVDLHEMIRDILAEPKEFWIKKRSEIIEGKANMTEYVTAVIDRHMK